jgi:hypothetical protein
LQRIRGIIRGQSTHVSGYNIAIKSFIETICKTVIFTNNQLASLRTTLIITACSTIVDLAFFHKDHSDATTELMTTSLVKTCGSSKRLLSSLAQNALRIVLTYTSYNPHYPNICSM